MVYKWLTDSLLPNRCPVCGSACASGLCAACGGELVRIEQACRRCGLPRLGSARSCGVTRWPLETTFAPLAYVEPLTSHVRDLKFGGRRTLGRALGELLAEELRGSAAAAPVDVLVAVPLHASRLRSRGYNQALEIARPIAAALGLPLHIAGIRRRRATSPQSQLSAPERRSNLRRAFVVSRDFTDLDVAIVDDVITTGATVNALAVELSRAGAASVRAWAVARSLQGTRV